MILRLAAKGTVTQVEIAKAVGCDQSTVSRVLSLLDTRKEARAILESGAARLADTVINTDDAGIALRALGKIDVVRDDKADQGARTRVFISVGMPPPGCPLFMDGDVIEARYAVEPPRVDGGQDDVGDGPFNSVHILRGNTLMRLPDHMGLAGIPPYVTVTADARRLLEARAVATPVNAA